MKTKPSTTTFYRDFQTLEDIEKEIENELKQLDHLNKVSEGGKTTKKPPVSQISSLKTAPKAQKNQEKSVEKEPKRPKKANSSNISQKVNKPETKKLINKYPLNALKNQQNDENQEIDIYERLRRTMPNQMIYNEKSLLEDLDNQEALFGDHNNNFATFELECSNPQIKTFSRIQGKVLEENKTIKNDPAWKQKPLPFPVNPPKDRKNSNIDASLNRRNSTVHENEATRKSKMTETKERRSSFHKSPAPNQTILKSRQSFSDPYQENPTFKPLLLKKSLIMADRMGDPMSRLTKESIAKNQEKLSVLNSEIYGKYSFKPSINQFSHKLVEKKRGKSIEKENQNLKPRWEELYALYKEKNKELEMKKVEHENRKFDDPELTFHPKLSKNHYIFYGYFFWQYLRKIIDFGGRENDLDLIERSRCWKSKVEEKLKNQRESMEGKDLEPCTFRPQISQRSQENIKHSQSSNELLSQPTNFNKMGIIQHFERIDQAKRLRNEKENILNKFNGSKWKNQITVPKEYPAHKKDSSLIRKKKTTEYMEISSKIASKSSKNNRSASFTNLNYSKTSWDLSESEEQENPLVKEDFETAVNYLHKELHNLDL